MNTLLVFDTNSSEWTEKNSSPIAVTGHTATLVDDKMIVLFGLSTDGLFPGVQEYDFGKISTIRKKLSRPVQILSV